MCTPVTPAVPYLLLGLQGVQWAVGNSCGARKLARTPHVNQKKKKEYDEAVDLLEGGASSIFSNYIYNYKNIKLSFNQSNYS
jgi:hypothetical protein